METKKRYKSQGKNVAPANKEFYGEIIRKAVYDYLNDSQGKKAPNFEMIAEKTGIHPQTVAKYFKDLDFKAMVTPMRALTPQVLNNIFLSSHKSVAAQKLWFQIVEGWSEKVDLSVSEDIKEIKVEIIENRSNKGIPSEL